MMKVIRNSVGERGSRIYEQDLRRRLETEENLGKFLVIDVETGEYELDEDSTAATIRARAKHPDHLVYRLRIGYPSTHTIAGPVRRAR